MPLFSRPGTQSLNDRRRDGRLPAEMEALEGVQNALTLYWRARNGRFDPTDLLALSVLSDFAQVVYGVDLLPVSQKHFPRPNFPSWLVKRPGRRSQVWVDADYYNLTVHWREGQAGAGSRHRAFVLASLLGHEAGHLSLGHELTSVKLSAPTGPFRMMPEIGEWEAWLYSGLLLTFVFAEESYRTRTAGLGDRAVDLLDPPASAAERG